MGKNDGLYILLAGGVALYMYNTNPNFKASIDKILHPQTAAATTGTDDTTTTTDTTTTAPATTTPATVFLAPNTGGVVLDSTTCKANYGGNCAGECKNGLSAGDCVACVAVCGAGSLKGIFKVDTNGNLTDKKTAHHQINQTKKERHAASQLKKVARTNPTPPATTPAKPCPARCAPFKDTAPATYATCCKGS